MKATVRWLGADGMAFMAESDSGHAITLDGPEEFGGKNLGPRPMEMLLIGLGGCSNFDVVLILQRSREDVRDCRVALTAERAETEPKVFTKIHASYTITGKNLNPKKVERAIQLSMEKYCSASIMLGKTAEISWEFEIIEAE